MMTVCTAVTVAKIGRMIGQLLYYMTYHIDNIHIMRNKIVHGIFIRMKYACVYVGVMGVSQLVP